MLYPVFSNDDGTEVTASKPDQEGRILLYIEKFDESKGKFLSATFVLPQMTLKTSSGYSDEELEYLSEKFFNLKEYIINYVMEKQIKKREMCYATKTSEVCAKIQVFVDLGKSLKETIDYILSRYDGITEAYIAEKYNLYATKLPF